MSHHAYCKDCKTETKLVFSHLVGDTVCSDCGLVLEPHSIDETSESSSSFANESSSSSDPNRVGTLTNPLLLLSDTALTIDFLSRWNNPVSNSDSGLNQGFKTIATMSESLGLVTTIKDRANEIYKKLDEQKLIKKGRNQDVLSAACLYISCRQEDKPRTIKEISSVVPNGVTKKEIGRAIKMLESTGQSLELGTIHAGDFMRRFCSKLGMSEEVVKAAQEAVVKSEEFDIRRSPISIAAAVIYIITELSDDNKSLKEISTATGVTEGTIRNVYKDLYPHLSKIVPSWYAKEECLKDHLSRTI